MIYPCEYTHFGYNYVDKIKDSNGKFVGYHSGVDFNFGSPDEDLGLPVKSTTNGTVIFARNTGKGWGNLIVIWHDSLGVYSRYGHLDKISVQEGQEVEEGDLVGTIGATGGNWSPHLHFDIILEKLPYWTQYINYWSLNRVKKVYADPIAFLDLHKTPEEPDIVLWNKQHHIIEQWSTPPTASEVKLGWIAYKIAKETILGGLNEDSFTL